MTLDDMNVNEMDELLEVLESEDSMRYLMEALLNRIAKAERRAHLQAGPYERTGDRKGYANGYKEKRLKTRVGELRLEVPQTRGTGFYPKSLDKGTRSERALKAAVAEIYISGVSTRKVSAVTKELCGLEFTSSQVSELTKELDEEFKQFRERPLGQFRYVYFDALYPKVRISGSVTSAAIFVAIGVNQENKREVIGVCGSLSEAEVHWRDFFESLSKRGLCGVELFISDNHPGLRAALRSVWPGVPWQRCQFHLMQNAISHAPKKSMVDDIVRGMRSVLGCTTRAAVDEAKRQVIKEFEKTAPEFVRWFEENIEESLTCLKFPESHRTKIRTTNGLERVNREIRRRIRVATLFPNMDSALRLITGVLIEIHEEWLTGKAYLSMETR